MADVIADGHLGGYIEGGDPDTYYPNLWAWLLDAIGAKSVLDVGCGDGIALDAFTALGVLARGVDGCDTGRADVVVHDFTTGLIPRASPPQVDLVWSCEFVEHVEAQYIDNFLPALAYGRHLAMTHAVPGQNGWHHVNCQDSDYWIEQLARYGMVLDPHLTAQARAVASTDSAVNNYFAATGLVFERST